MPTLRELNEGTSLGQQLQSNEDGSVVLINVFTIDEEDEKSLLTAWKADAEFMKKQPGYISTQMHRAIAGSMTFLNYAVWESIEDFRNAFTNPEFQKHLSSYPESAVVSPHLFKKMSIPGHCVS